MRDFAAIDFETANNQRSSVCSVGVVVVRNGEIADTFYHQSGTELLHILVLTGTRTHP